MKLLKYILIFLFVFGLVSASYAESKKMRIFVVSSYHREYLWSQDTHLGVCAALLDLKFLENKAQTEEFTKNDFVEAEKTVLKKAWMDTKRKSSTHEIAQATARIVEQLQEFKPDLILLGDDNAANYIGNQFIDTDIPVIFWGINGDPLKYGLVDSIKTPGHNVSGIAQPGYLKECVDYLKKLAPSVNTIAILSDDSETGRSKTKEIENLAAAGAFSLKLAGPVVTNSFAEWQAKALALEKDTDAFFILNHNSIKDDKGNPVDPLQVMAWYLKNIKKPDCADQKQGVQEGSLITVDDSGYKQGYEAVKMASQVLFNKISPANIPVISPVRGAIIVNRQVAQMLGIDLSGKDFIEEYIDKSLALEKYSQ